MRISTRRSGRVGSVSAVVVASVAAAVLAVAATEGHTTRVAVAAAAAPVTPGYTAVTPSRLLDTREASDGPRLSAGVARTLQVSGRGTVPASGAVAVVLNVTVTEAVGTGFVTVWPTGVSRPLASNLNMVAGATTPNLVTVGLGSGGRVELFSSTDAHLVVDVVGWYASGLVAVTPSRLMDTREGDGGIVLGPGETRVLAVAGRAGIPATGAIAVALNVTVVDPSSAGFVTVWPSGARPNSSNANFVAGQTRANAVLVGLGSDGAVRLFNSSGQTDLVVDVAGWFDSGFEPVAPRRLMDTREGLGGIVLGPGESRRLTVVGVGGVPSSGVGAVALNVTGTEPTGAPFITVWPSLIDRPLASNLNLVPGETAPNAVIVGVGADGAINLFNSAGNTHLVVDVAGWYPIAAGADHEAPQISALAATAITTTSATLTWITDEPATSRSDYGLTAAYGSSTALASSLVISHTRTITGLSAGTTYHARVRSTDAAGNERVSGDITFSTSAGSFTFESAVSYASGGHSHGVAAVDVTGSSALDLVVANALDGTVTVLAGRGDGTFATPPALTLAVGSEPKAVMAGQLNPGGVLDLVTANQGSGTVSVLLGTGSGGFAPAASYTACPGAHEPVLADLDGDGDVDIAVACWGSTSIRVLANDGAGAFTSAATPNVGAGPHSVVAVDIDGDLDRDLAIANHDADSVTVLRNDGSMTFSALPTISVGGAPHSIRWADLDHDGDADLVTANDAGNSVSVLRNNGAGVFTRTDVATGETPKSVALADLDGDGNIDVITANINGNYPTKVNPDTNAVAVLRGNGDGTLRSPVFLSVEGTPFAVIAADLDADGRLDLITANWHAGTTSVLLGRT
jgi:hypothetical protein